MGWNGMGRACASAALRKRVIKEHFEFERGLGELAIHSTMCELGGSEQAR